MLADVQRWPEWTASVTSAQLLDARDFKSGSRVRIKQPKLPSVVWQVTGFDPGRSFEWRAGAPGLRSVARHIIEAADSGSRATLWIEQTGVMARLLNLFYRSLTQRYVRMEAEGLKSRSEASH